jgi:hypothetical protein
MATPLTSRWAAASGHLAQYGPALPGRRAVTDSSLSKSVWQALRQLVGTAGLTRTKHRRYGPRTGQRPSSNEQAPGGLATPYPDLRNLGLRFAQNSTNKYGLAGLPDHSKVQHGVQACCTISHRIRQNYKCPSLNVGQTNHD